MPSTRRHHHHVYGVELGHGQRPFSSVRRRSPLAGELTVSTIKPTFNWSSWAGLSGSDMGYS